MSDTPPRRILGIDPGLQVTGYAVLETRDGAPHVCEAGFIKTSPNRSTDLSARLRVLYDGIVEVLDEFKPDRCAVEQLFSHYEHPRTAILMGHARGVIFLAIAQRDIPVTSYAPTRIKKTITGSGRASKEQVQYTMLRELGLDAVPEPHDVADALAAALCHYYFLRRTA